MSGHIIAVTNQKGGVGKTTTVVNLAHALSVSGKSVLMVDLDPSGNASQGMGIDPTQVGLSVCDFIQRRELPAKSLIYKGPGLDLIPARSTLAAVQKEMVGQTNSELRLAARLRELKSEYEFVLIDTPPTFGALLNSALHAADSLIVPVHAFYGMCGIVRLHEEVREIQAYTNPSLKILGYLLTLHEETNLAKDVTKILRAEAGDLLFKTKIRKTVRLSEAPALGKTIFQHAPSCSGSINYLNLAAEVLYRLGHLAEEPVIDGDEKVVERIAHERPRLMAVGGVE